MLLESCNMNHEPSTVPHSSSTVNNPILIETEPDPDGACGPLNNPVTSRESQVEDESVSQTNAEGDSRINPNKDNQEQDPDKFIRPRLAREEYFNQEDQIEMTRHQRGLLESYHQFKDQEDSCDLQDAAAAHAAAAAAVEDNFVAVRRGLKRKRDLFSSSRPADAATEERGGCPAEQMEAGPADVTEAGGCAKCTKCIGSCKGARRKQRRIQPDPHAPPQPQDPPVQEVQMEMTPFLTPETTPEKTPQKTSERSPYQRRSLLSLRAL